MASTASLGDEQSPDPEPEDSDNDDMAEANTRASSEEKSPNRGGDNANNNKSASKSNAKDPSRPRRKKARRACFACQRAHLTCGDERPCLRCIKRGLQDQCHDGVRKKAKYLHDAPPEALIPGFAGNYPMNGSAGMQNVPGAPQMGMVRTSQGGTFYAPNASSGYPGYDQLTQQGTMPPQIMQNPSIVGVDPAASFQANTNQQISPVQTMSTGMDGSSVMPSAGSFDSSYIDPNDPSLFNFNISEMNFGNRYGAMELGMLGQMSSAALNTPDVEGMGLGHSNQGSISYEGLASNFGYDAAFQSWQSVPNYGIRQNSSQHLWTLNNNDYVVGENTSSVTGASEAHDFSTGYSSSTVSPEIPFSHPDENQSRDRQGSRPQKRKRVPFPKDMDQTTTPKRARRNTAEIYASVQEPYPYTQGFHNLTDFLHKRFPSHKVLRIAKALASIRPSFISCNKGLNSDDLIFMEKCFQRTLFEYHDFVHCYGTPTIIIRRTGEIAHVNKEFCLVTGWRESVILGKEPNLNVNTGENAGESRTGSSTKSTATPRIPPITKVEPGRPQPVLMAEILDEDTVVQFWEDFAELAFGASRSSIIGATCSMIKYKTKEDPGWGPEERQAEDGTVIKTQSEIKTEPLMKGEAGINSLGEVEDKGRVKAACAWTVKRDVFDIPMMVVMNFLPII